MVEDELATLRKVVWLTDEMIQKFELQVIFVIKTIGLFFACEESFFELLCLDCGKRKKESV